MNSNSYKKPTAIPISEEALVEAKGYADGLDRDRTFNRKVGKWDDLFRSCIGQIMTHLWLNDNLIAHEYMKPYHPEGRPDNEFDIRIADEEYDVKCRARWNEEYFFNIKILMGEHEKEEKLKVDYYIFGTTDNMYRNFYILGAISYCDLWEKLHNVDNPEKYPFPPAGYILSRELGHLIDIVYRT